MLVPPLSVRLREGTRESHRQAESTPFIRGFFAGELSLESYRNFLVQLQHIYTSLEASQEGLDSHPVFEKIYYPQLFRTRFLAEDLTHYFGDERWRSLEPHPVAQECAERMQLLRQEAVEGLVAHHYTRYLGDLSGGQALKRIVMKMFPGSSGAGLAFYEFPDIPDAKTFKNEYRAGLDAMPVSEETAEEIVAEAVYAFDLNRRLMEGIGM